MRNILIAGAAALATATSVLASDCNGLIAGYNALGAQYNKTVELTKAAGDNIAKYCGHLDVLRSLNNEMLDARQKMTKCKVKRGEATIEDVQARSEAIRLVISDECVSRSGSCSKRVSDQLKIWTEKFEALANFDYKRASKSEACAQRNAIDSTATGAMSAVSNLRAECADYFSRAKPAAGILREIADMAVKVRTLKETTPADCR